jgi:hypothetical protein
VGLAEAVMVDLGHQAQSQQTMELQALAVVVAEIEMQLIRQLEPEKVVTVVLV